MPTYQDALSAEPSEFIGYASEMTAAAADLATHQSEYGEQVAWINVHWKDTANDAFNGEVGNVNAHVSQVIGEVTAAAGSLSATGAQMVAQCTALKVADAALKATGFDVQPAPLVTLGALQRTAIAMAGPFGALLEAALQAQAAAGTLGLQALLSLVNAADAAAGAALSTAADLLKPLEDKSGGSGEEGRGLHRLAEDHTSEAEKEGASEEDEAAEEETEEAEESGEPEEEASQEEPGGSAAEQPAMPQNPSGMEDFAQPEVPEVENPWEAVELPDPEDYTGGLASGGGSGGGLGGGVGSGLGGGLAAGTGTVSPGALGTGAVGAPVGAAGAAATGSKAGAGGAMMGGGGRGAGGGSDDEVTRESFLTEDPDEDVWGIAKLEGDDNPYA
ncbi:hypothetical protein [Glycomyces sp. NRRL B-16210]|uniref:hypothetical protein n=1 Tax=Glycomyces sp. NRRL B-16210 TaxID=1463821 RepID=UPI000AB9DBA0|nr:hypothetical protein [Glycomyces sp. NRRL B-16210]